MCDFFSFVENNRGKKYYFNWQQRQEILKGKLFDKRGQSVIEADSHSQICAYYDLKCDSVNKYEGNPLTKKFVVDQVNTKDRREQAKEWFLKLDFKEIVEPLIIKPTVNPFEIKGKRVTKKDIENLKKWSSVKNSVWDSVRASVRVSVWSSVWASVGDSVWSSVRASVWDSVRASVRVSVWSSVRASVGDSVWDSVWASVGASVWSSVRAYISSFFSLEKWKYIEHKPGENPFQSCIDLWHRGFVPSFDGKVWRLHTSKGVVFEISNTKLLKEGK